VATELDNFRRGDTFTISFDFGTGVDITGYEIWFSMRDTFTSDLRLQIKTTCGNNVADEPLNGKMYLFVDEASSIALDPGKYKWDIQRVIPGINKDVYTIIPTLEYYKEPLIVYPDVTWVTV
jgi:hypothetical protein